MGPHALDDGLNAVVSIPGRAEQCKEALKMRTTFLLRVSAHAPNRVVTAGHVATTTLLLFLTMGSVVFDVGRAEPVTVPLERETLVIPHGLEGWDLAWHAAQVNMHNLEWVTGGESVENWSQLFTVTRLVNGSNIGADRFAALTLEMLRHGCPGLQSSFLARSSSDALFEWQVAGCSRTDDQHELVRIVQSGDYLFRIAYTRKGDPMPALLREQWLSVLRVIEPLHCCDADDQGLSMIPLLQIYESFDFNKPVGMGLWFEPVEVPDEATGDSLADRAPALQSAGFPTDHTYDVFWVTLSPTRGFAATPFARGVIANAAGALACPPASTDTSEDTPADDGLGEGDPGICAKLPGVPLSNLLRMHGVRFQPGLPMAIAVRSTDGAHATYAKLIPNPIKAANGACEVELELVSTDARTYVAYGTGFPPGQSVSLTWTYAKNAQKSSATTDSDGSFVAAINHPGEAKGRGKWNAVLEAATPACRVTVEYKWGEAGMKP